MQERNNVEESAENNEKTKEAWNKRRTAKKMAPVKVRAEIKPLLECTLPADLQGIQGFCIAL